MNFFSAKWLFLFCSFFLVACDKQDNVNPISERPKVALIMKSMANEFFVNMAQAARNHQQAHAQDYELLINGIKNESDLAQQVALVDQMIAMGVKAIVICPADSKALVPALVRAQRAGISVVNIDNRLDAEVLKELGATIPFIGPSNSQGAKLVADYVLKDLPEKTPVIILEGIPSANNSIERRLGFTQSIAQYHHDLLSVQSAAWDQTKAVELTSAMLSQYPQVRVILAANDNMALGAASAVAMANLDHDVAIAGVDNISAVRPLIDAGKIKATLEQHGDQFAIYGIEFALDMLAGKVAMVDRETPVNLITANSVTAVD
jgi:ribose transport system substrate-binding protein